MNKHVFLKCIKKQQQQQKHSSDLLISQAGDSTLIGSMSSKEGPQAD